MLVYPAKRIKQWQFCCCVHLSQTAIGRWMSWTWMMVITITIQDNQLPIPYTMTVTMSTAWPDIHMVLQKIAEPCAARNNPCLSHPSRRFLAKNRKKRDPKKNEEKMLHTKRKRRQTEKNSSNPTEDVRKDLNAIRVASPKFADHFNTCQLPMLGYLSRIAAVEQVRYKLFAIIVGTFFAFLTLLRKHF